MTRLASNRHLVVCVKNEGYEVSLERRKIYVAIEDEEAKSHRMVRVIDEWGDDYLYPRKLFLPSSTGRLRHISALAFFWVRRSACFPSEAEMVSGWGLKRDGNIRGIVEVTKEAT